MARGKVTAVDPMDKKWQEESDARTLAEAAAIRKDKSRLSGAKAGAKRMVEAEQDRLSGLKSVARTKVSKKKKR